MIRDAAIPAGPLAQSVKIAFRAIYAAVAVFAVSWACGNIRQIPADSRAVILRFGGVSRTQEAGLLLAWPQPIEDVRLLPAEGRPSTLEVRAAPASFVSDETDMQFTPNDDIIHLRADRDADNEAYLLTGDGNAVKLEATLSYVITDPAAYVLTESHVVPALRRAYRAGSVQIAARHPLDDFLVAEPQDGATADAATSSRREAVRAELVADVNRRLSAFQIQGTNLGIRVSRIDLIAVLPPVAKAAFDEVLTASQIADQNVAAAQTDAARITQESNRDHDRMLSEATAAADERIHTAMADTVGVIAVEAKLTPQNRSGLFDEYYKDQIGRIVQKAGKVTAIDAAPNQRIILPGAGK